VPSKFSERSVVAVGVLGIATRLLLLPLQIVEGVAVSEGTAGSGLTVTTEVIIALEQPFAVAVIE